MRRQLPRSRGAIRLTRLPAFPRRRTAPGSAPIAANGRLSPPLPLRGRKLIQNRAVDMLRVRQPRLDRWRTFRLASVMIPLVAASGCAKFSPDGGMDLAASIAAEAVGK